MTVPQGNVRFFCNVGRIRSIVPLRPTFEDDETWYCGTAIAVPYVKLHIVLGVTGYYNATKAPGSSEPGALRLFSDYCTWYCGRSHGFCSPADHNPTCSSFLVGDADLALDTAGAVAAGQLLDLSHSDMVVVAADGVLQSGSSNGELNGLLAGLAGQQGVDQTAAEGVTAADAVDDVQVVLLGEAVVLAVVQHCGPAVVECGVAFMFRWPS